MRSVLTRSMVTTIVAVALLSVTAPTILHAQTPDSGLTVDSPLGRPGMPLRLLGPLFPILRRLELTTEERQQIRDILQGHREELRGLMRRAIEARKPLFEAVYLDAFDEGAIRDRSASLAGVQADESVLRAKIRTEIFAVLTPDQQTRAIEALKRFENRRGRQTETDSSPF